MLSDVTFVPLGLQPSFGFGDRIGLATPGHIEAMRRAGGGIAPIFAQQSIREMSRTGRSSQEVVRAAQAAMKQRNWLAPTGADADHLKTTADVDATMAAGFTFFTLDPSDYVDDRADDYDEPTLREKFAAVRASTEWFARCLNRRVPLANGNSFVIDEQAAMRCAVKYGRAIRHAVDLARYIGQAAGKANRDYELELSIDETRQPTSLAEHFIIADQFRQSGITLVSLAPRFRGDFEKGVDFKGDLNEFERSLTDHAALARELGPYKLSLHSGSDKLSLYPILSRITRGCFHVKTAGTSYLEALRVIVRHDEPLFGRIVETSRRFYDRDRATYHVSAEVAALPSAAECPSIERLESIYLGRWEDVPTGCGFTEPGRQVLHCTFGTIMTDDKVGPAIRNVLEEHLDTYTEVLTSHFERHLQALVSGR